MRTLVAIHLLGDALLLWLGYYWLGLGETSAATLVWSVFIASLLLSLTSVLHAATLRRGAGTPACRDGTRAVATSAARLFLTAITLLIVYFLLAQWAAYSVQPAFKIASWLTLTFRKPTKPSTIQTIFNAALWLIRWMLVPVIALSLSTKSKHLRNPRYWMAVPILLLCAIWLPLKLLAWVPHAGAFTLQMASFTLRALIAYLLFVAGTLALDFLTQSIKVASP